MPTKLMCCVRSVWKLIVLDLWLTGLGKSCHSSRVCRETLLPRLQVTINGTPISTRLTDPCSSANSKCQCVPELKAYILFQALT